MTYAAASNTPTGPRLRVTVEHVQGTGLGVFYTLIIQYNCLHFTKVKLRLRVAKGGRVC